MNRDETSVPSVLFAFVYSVVKWGIPFFFISLVVLAWSFTTELIRSGSLYSAYWWSIGQSPGLAIVTATLFVFTLTYLTIRNLKRVRMVTGTLMFLARKGENHLNNLLLMQFEGIPPEPPPDSTEPEADQPEMGN